MKPEHREAALLLQHVGEVQFGQKVRVRKVRMHRVAVAHVSLMLHDDGGVWERTITVVDAPDEARSGLETTVAEAAGRPVPIAEIPEVLRERIDEAIEEQKSLGYTQVALARVVVHEEDVYEVKYRVASRPWLSVFVGSAPPRVIGYREGRGLYGLSWGWSPNARPLHTKPKRQQVIWAIGFMLWFLFLVRSLLY